jgi:hypothetical protein
MKSDERYFTEWVADAITFDGEAVNSHVPPQIYTKKELAYLLDTLAYGMRGRFQFKRLINGKVTKVRNEYLVDLTRTQGIAEQTWRRLTLEQFARFENLTELLPVLWQMQA